MKLSGILGHGAGSGISQWDTTITSPWLCTVISWYPSWYDHRCCQYVKLLQPTSRWTRDHVVGWVCEHLVALRSGEGDTYLHENALDAAVPAWVGWLLHRLLEFYVLTTFKVTSRQVPTCDSSQSWWVYSAAPLGNQTWCHSTLLSWHWANQSLSYRKNADNQCR